jgi:alpha-mannosidase
MKASHLSALPAPPRRSRWRKLAFLGLALSAIAPVSQAHEVYLMNSNHTDYNWNATAAEYDQFMMQEIGYYLDQIAATAGNPTHEQARYTADNWWFLYLYETRRPGRFPELVSAIESGHITIPLNPFVTLYGALPTEAVVRAGYYPGRMERQYGISFPLAENTENHTNPWGLASIWAGSGVRYGWKGVCGCVQSAPHRSDEELFFWQGPDKKTILFKWYELLGSNKDWGGYSETRNNLGSPADLNFAIGRTETRLPGIDFTGLFGAGWDDVEWKNTQIVDAVVAYNDTNSPDTAIVSNGIDFFAALEASGQTSSLDTLKGGWGNDWDMWPASLAERTSRNRRAFELLRTAEVLAAWVHSYDVTFWPPVRDDIETGLVSVWKYFEHGWDVTAGGPTLEQMQADKEKWTRNMEKAVVGAIADAESRLQTLFDTPNQDRLAVFNPLAFERSDFAELLIGGNGPYRVVDIATGTEVPSQILQRNGESYLRFLATSVPSLGYRVYRLFNSSPASRPNAAVVDPVARSIESDLYRVVLGDRGQLLQVLDKKPNGQELARGSDGLGDYGSGTILSVTEENVGPVSATLKVTLSNPSREVRVTLFKAIDRIEIEHAILENETGDRRLTFHSGLAGSQIRFEEIGAVARPGLQNQGGDFLQGTRASRMTLNHFVDFAESDYHMVLSNWDAFAMQVNDSTNDAFDLTGDRIHVIVMERQSGAGTADQGGDDFFLNRFAIRGVSGAFNAAEAMRTSLAHQNPFYVVSLPRNQNGPISTPTGGLLAIDASNVVVTAFKPAEDEGAGFLVRLWELNGKGTTLGISASGIGAQSAWQTSLVETDWIPVLVQNGKVQNRIDANEMRAFRISDQPGDEGFVDGFESGNTAAWSAVVP